MTIPLLTPRELSSLRRRLLYWFDRNRRELPWRRDRDPYRIWISEVMLQQTTVAAVVPRFEQFLVKFPTLHHLAEAEERDVLRGWEGLGYYRRARDLHRAARTLVNDHAGLFPDHAEIWSELPGVGRYILGAVMSQAFDRRLPVVEANSKRVLCRLFGQRNDPKSKPVSDWLWQMADTILPNKRVGDFNQAIMELGALVCTPVSPNCRACPLSKMCVANRDGTQDEIPVKSAASTFEAVREIALVIRRGSKVLLVQRPEIGRWANMWEFPHHPVENLEADGDTAERLLVETLGLRAEIVGELLTVRHTVTRFRITMRCMEAKYRNGSFVSSYYKDGRWVEPIELHAYPVSTPQRKLAASVTG